MWRKADLIIGDGQWGKGTVWGGPSGDAGVYPITSAFGPRDPLNTPAGTTSGFHQGLDIGYPEGVPLVALFDGVVTAVMRDHPSLGNFLVYSPVDLGVDDDGWAQIWYGHMSDISVEQGDRVAEGALLGHVGSTGMASGPHLHLEVRNRWGCIDPFNALMTRGLRNAPQVTGPEVGEAPANETPVYQPLTRDEVCALVQEGAAYVDLGPATSAVVVFT